MRKISIFGTCSHCLASSNTWHSSISHLGGVGECSHCGRQVARHQCSAPAFKADWWLPILESGISASCPSCGAVMRIARQVQNTPDIPEWVNQVASVALGASIIIGVAMFADSFSRRTKPFLGG